jgi:mRNA-degrading endonuclease RelE of RelBE toxin-antitoxin system
MVSETTEAFRRQVRELPESARSMARQAYRKWLSNPRHPSLQFKRIHLHEPIYSVRIGIHWRAVCVVEGDTATWFWIGSHAAYDALIKKMRQR